LAASEVVPCAAAEVDAAALLLRLTMTAGCAALPAICFWFGGATLGNGARLEVVCDVAALIPAMADMKRTPLLPAD
jgi:hypothetical protein